MDGIQYFLNTKRQECAKNKKQHKQKYFFGLHLQQAIECVASTHPAQVQAVSALPAAIPRGLCLRLPAAISGAAAPQKFWASGKTRLGREGGPTISREAE